LLEPDDREELPEDRLLDADGREELPLERLLDADGREPPLLERLLPAEGRERLPEERLLPTEDRERLDEDRDPLIVRDDGADEYPRTLPAEPREPERGTLDVAGGRLYSEDEVPGTITGLDAPDLPVAERGATSCRLPAEDADPPEPEFTPPLPEYMVGL
jgi:hypothetical protein